MSIAIRIRCSVVKNRGTKFLHNTYKFLNGSFGNFKFFGKASRITGIPFLNKPVNGLQAGYKCFGHGEERFYESKGLVSLLQGIKLMAFVKADYGICNVYLVRYNLQQRNFFTNKWVAENEGVAPDIEVRQDAKSLHQGRDPQLERAVKEVLSMLEKQPQKEVKAPAYPKPAQTKL